MTATARTTTLPLYKGLPEPAISANLRKPNTLPLQSLQAQITRVISHPKNSIRKQKNKAFHCRLKQDHHAN